MADVTEIFGASAGLVWKELKENGPMTSKDLGKRTKLKAGDVYGAIGWLAREGKIAVDVKSKTHTFALLE